jgi:hypothetical protein
MWITSLLLVALMLVPRCLAATGSRLRENLPMALFGWGNKDMVSWKKGPVELKIEI